MRVRLGAIAGRGRGPVLGLASQLLNAGTNVVTAYAASRLLAPGEFGRFVIAFAAVTIVLAAGRGLIGATMMVHLPAQDDDARPALVRSALGFTLVAGLAVSALLVVAGLAEPVLWLFAPWATVALLQDIGRYVFLADDRAERALALDIAWAVVQATVFGLGALFGTVTLGLVSTAWGLGALAGLVLFAALSRARPARPGAWARATRDVAGWFTGVAVVSQVEVYLILLLTGVILSAQDVGGVRTVQLLAFQPPAVLLGALLTVMQPAVVRARHSAPATRRAWGRVTVVVLPVVLGLAVLAVLREPLMGLLFPQYVGFAPLVIPIAVQSFFLALCTGPLCVLNGLRQGSIALRSQLLRTVTLVGAAALGMELDGTVGLAAGLALASGASWIQLSLAARAAIARIPSPAREDVVRTG